LASNRDIIVVGASAGGIEALQEVVHDVPVDFRGSMFVVVHIPADVASRLPSVLNNSGPLRAAPAQHNEPIQPGRIYVAVPDHHLLLEKGRVLLWRGPKEDRHRPAVNALFRSAAAAHGARVVGVVLSGVLNDGSAGLWWVKRHGGTAIVQDPATARFPDMPKSVLEYVQADYVAKPSEIGPLLTRLARMPISESVKNHKPGTRSMEKKEILELTCPECNGPLSEIRHGRMKQFRCLVGHAYTDLSILQAHAEAQEAALWQAVATLEQSPVLVRHLRDRIPPKKARRLLANAEKRLKLANEARRLIEQLEPFDVE
jgi:two-component system chemotaxis response regulator CheB